jgi:hypothetical protein
MHLMPLVCWAEAMGQMWPCTVRRVFFSSELIEIPEIIPSFVNQ